MDIIEILGSQRPFSSFLIAVSDAYNGISFEDTIPVFCSKFKMNVYCTSVARIYQ